MATELHPGLHPGLLAAVLDAPDDDAPRLCVADWLDEHGDPARAEFVRVQCELARPGEEVWALVGECGQCRDVRVGSQHTNGPCRCTERRKALRRRERELSKLWVRDCAPWSYDFIAPLLGPNWLQLSAGWQWYWARGFIESIELPCADFMRHAAAVFACQPITAVTLGDRDPIDGTAWTNADAPRGRSRPSWAGPRIRRTAEEMERGSLPDRLFRHLPYVTPIHNWIEYPSFAGQAYTAKTALAAACLSFGRGIVNNPVGF